MIRDGLKNKIKNQCHRNLVHLNRYQINIGLSFTRKRKSNVRRINSIISLIFPIQTRLSCIKVTSSLRLNKEFKVKKKRKEKVLRNKHLIES